MSIFLTPRRMLSAAWQSVKFRFAFAFRAGLALASLRSPVSGQTFFIVHTCASLTSTLQIPMRKFLPKLIADAFGKSRKFKQIFDIAPRQVQDKSGHAVRGRV